MREGEYKLVSLGEKYKDQTWTFNLFHIMFAYLLFLCHTLDKNVKFP